jgi:hypothetical protein
MKRTSALAPLSRDHHHALVVAARLRRATPATASAARDAFLAYWHLDGSRHFREEEEILLPAYAAHGNPQHPLLVRVLVDHLTIRALAEALGHPTAPALATLQELGVTLSDHVRLEERRLFPLIEETLPAVELEQLAQRLQPTAPNDSGPDPAA